MIPIDCKLSLPDVVKGAWPHFFWRFAFVSNKQVQTGRESVDGAAGVVLGFCTIVDPM